MAINDIVQTIAEARVDARSLSEFVFKPAGFKVTRRLAPTVDTLQFYINRFNSLNGDFSSSVSVALSSLNNSVAEADGKVAYIETTVQDAINNTAVEGGVLADTFVTATPNGVGTIARTQRDKNSDRLDIRDYGVVADKTTDWTVKILEVLATLPENSKIYIPMGVKWAATSNPAAVYAAMSDNSVLIDDSGYEDRYGVKYWQASQQKYYKTKDYGGVGHANGNSHNIRGDYHPAYCAEVDSALGGRGSRASTIYRFLDPTIGTAFQVGGDFTNVAAQAHFAMAMYSGDLETKFLRVGAPMSISPAGVFWNGQIVQDVSYFYGKRRQRNDETEVDYKSSSLSVRHLMASDHTGNFDITYFYGTSIAYREIIDNTGRYRVVTKNSKTLTTTADGEQFGAKLSVVTPTTNAVLSEALSGSYYSNVSAGGGFTLTLPKAIKGTYFEFSVDIAKNLRVIPSAGTTFIGESTGKYLESAVVGSRLRITAVSADAWSVEKIGTWTSEP